MAKYWYEKRMWGSSLVIWPVSWQGWLFQPLGGWLLFAVPGFWLVSTVSAKWKNTAGVVVAILALVLTLVVLLYKTDPGPGWLSGWENEKRIVSKFGWVSTLCWFAGAFVCLDLTSGSTMHFGIPFLIAYFYAATALLYKVIDPTKDTQV